jgi:hypothetical protein
MNVEESKRSQEFENWIGKLTWAKDSEEKLQLEKSACLFLQRLIDNMPFSEFLADLCADFIGKSSPKIKVR